MNYSSIERKSFKIGLIFTILTHISIVIISYYSSHKKQENNFIKRPEYIEAVLLKKGDKDGGGKNKKFLPDKENNNSKSNVIKDNNKNTKDDTKLTKDDSVKNEKNTEKTNDDSIDLSKKLSDISKKLENDNSKSNLTNLTNKISKDLSNRTKNTNGKTANGNEKGHKDGVEEGTETDPSKTVQGSLYGRRIATELKKQWKIPPIDESQLSDLVVTATIFISEDGTILKYKIIKESKKVLFTNSVKFLLEKVKKVASPPSDYAEYYEKYGMEIDFVPKKE